MEISSSKTSTRRSIKHRCARTLKRIFVRLTRCVRRLTLKRNLITIRMKQQESLKAF
jgi:hypothetical protein